MHDWQDFLTGLIDGAGLIAFAAVGALAGLLLMGGS